MEQEIYAPFTLLGFAQTKTQDKNLFGCVRAIPIRLNWLWLWGRPNLFKKAISGSVLKHNCPTLYILRLTVALFWRRFYKINFSVCVLISDNQSLNLHIKRYQTVPILKTTPLVCFLRFFFFRSNLYVLRLYIMCVESSCPSGMRNTYRPAF